MSSIQIPFDTFKNPVCKGAFEFGSACGHCEKCQWIKAHMAIGCNHIKVYATYILECNPPKRPWICSVCGTEGIDSVALEGGPSYDELKRKFNGSRL